MASTTRGSIKISTANGIGAALVDVLGGEGYKPDEWEQNINLCGIHAADIESALENIEEDAGTGTERGSILLTTANAIGRTLNKKFNTSRGFSPREWASAASKLEPLPERTASGAIANITDGADGVPVKSWQVTLPASLSGYSEIGCTKSGKNLANIGAVTTCTNRPGSITNNGDGTITVTTGNQQNVKSMQTLGDICPYVKVGEEYYLSADSTGTNKYIYLHQVSTIWNYGAKKTITAEMLASDVSFYASGANGTTATISNLMLRPAIDTDATYEAYTAPTTATASLGRTIYGGTADVVNGTGTDGYGYIVFDGSNDETWGGYSAYNGYYIDISDMKSGTRQDGVCNQLTCSKSTAQGQTNVFWLGAGNKRFYVIGVYDSMGNTLEAFKAYLAENPLILVYPLATATDFTFTPIPTPETALGVNNFWSDQGESSVTYRKDLDIPDPVPGNLLGMNNGNNNEEESEG